LNGQIQAQKKSDQDSKHKYFKKNFKSGKNEEKSQKRLLKCRKWHFLENLSLQTGGAGFDKVENQILPQIHIK